MAYVLVSLVTQPFTAKIFNFTHLKLFFANAIHNIKWVKIIQKWHNRGLWFWNLADCLTLTNSILINQHIFVHFQNWYFSAMVKWSKSISLYRDILSWIRLPLRYTEKGSLNVDMPIITIFLLEQDDEALDSFGVCRWLFKINGYC